MGNSQDPTFLPELGVIREDVQCERVVPSIDKLNSFIEIFDGDDG